MAFVLPDRPASTVDECFSNVRDMLVCRFAFHLAEPADGRDDIASDGMASKDGLPKLRRISCGQQKAEILVEWIKGLIIDFGESGPMVLRCFGKARRDAGIFCDDRLHGPMFGCLHWQVQRLRTGQFLDPFAWVDELRADDESPEIAIEAAH